MLRLMFSLAILAASSMSAMAKDYRGSKTYRKDGCKGCCSIANSDNKHVHGGVTFKQCSECDMTCHRTGCPER